MCELSVLFLLMLYGLQPIYVTLNSLGAEKKTNILRLNVFRCDRKMIFEFDELSVEISNH